MVMKFFKTTILFGLVSLLFFGCKSDDQEDYGKIEINDTSVVNADVNAADYWSNTELVWSDEFDGNSVSESNWVFEVGSAGKEFTELQNYTEQGSVTVSNGTLKIHAKKTGNGQQEGDYSSARLNSKYAFTYGRLEMRAKLPNANGNGLWVKLWMLGNNIDTVFYPACGEIAFMEYVSHLPNEIYTTVHTAHNSVGNGVPFNSGPVPLDTAEEEFHNYGVLWTDEYLKFYVDSIDNIIYTLSRPPSANDNNWPFTNSQFFVMNIAVGGIYGGVEGVDDNIFPATMEVDYVRVYHAK